MYKPLHISQVESMLSLCQPLLNIYVSIPTFMCIVILKEIHRISGTGRTNLDEYQILTLFLNCYMNWTERVQLKQT
jgi:hypothetical protein